MRSLWIAVRQIKTAFWDTSALLPLFCRDQFSVQSRDYVRKYPEIVIWWGTPVEIRSTFMRLLHETRMTAEKCTKSAFVRCRISFEMARSSACGSSSRTC